MEELETIIMELLVNAGAARSQALTALQLARKGDFAGAEQAMKSRAITLSWRIKSSSADRH